MVNVTPCSLIGIRQRVHKLKGNVFGKYIPGYTASRSIRRIFVCIVYSRNKGDLVSTEFEIAQREARDLR